MSQTIVKFNRQFTQQQLTAAEGLSTINGTSVVDGTWYVAKTGALALYVGSIESGSSATLKKVADIQDLTGLDATVTKSASGASDAASSRSDSVQVISGFTIEEVDGKLVANSSSVTSKKVDMAGAASKAYDDAKTYADGLITALGTIMHFEGVKSSEAAIKALTNVKKGDVWINSADHSEWVATDNIGSTADASKWEKFGTTDVANALFKGDNVFTDGYLLLADGTDGKVKASAIATVMANYKTKQTAVTPTAGTTVGSWDGQYVEQVTQNANGEITVTRKKLPTPTSGSGSVGSTSSAADAWKTVVHDASLSSGHVLSGNTKSIPAATAGNSAANSTDGYMTGTQAYNLSLAVSCLIWEE